MLCMNFVILLEYSAEQTDPVVFMQFLTLYFAAYATSLSFEFTLYASLNVVIAENLLFDIEMHQLAPNNQLIPINTKNLYFCLIQVIYLGFDCCPRTLI